MIRRAVLALAVLALAVVATDRSRAEAQGQVYTPQSSTGLTVSFQTERMGGSRVLFYGEVRNGTGSTFERIVLLAEGLDESGKVVSRARSYISGTIGPTDRSQFELRFLASGSERRYRITVESFQQVAN